MIPLDYAGTRKLQLVTAQNGASVVVGFSDFDTSTKAYDRGVPQCTTVSSATTTDICATPASGKIRDVDSVFIANTYAGSNAMTLQVASASGGPFVIENFTLLQNESAEYTHGSGVRIKDASGQYKVTLTGTAGAFAVGGALSVTGASTVAAITASGLATFNAGATVASGQTLTLTGATVAGAPTWSSTQSLNTSGNAATVTTNANLTGPITSVGNATTIASGNTYTNPTLSGTVGGTPAWTSAQAITLSTAAQPNVTSLGTLTGLVLSGTITTNSSIDIYAGTAVAANRRYYGDASNTVIRSGATAIVFQDASGNTIGTMNGSTSALNFGSNSLTAGAITSDGGLQTFGANDSAGAGYRLVKVPNI